MSVPVYERQQFGPQPLPKYLFAPDTEPRGFEVAWAAGFFDGEGWSTSVRGGSKTRRYLQIGITQKDTRALIRFKTAVDGLGHIRTRTNDLSVWRSNGLDAYLVMQRLWPCLGEVKREQFLQVDSDLL